MPQHFHELARDKAVVLLRQALEQVSAVLAPDYPQLHADPRRTVNVVAAPLHLHDDDHVALHSGPRRAVVAAPLRLVLHDHPDLRFEHPRRVVPVVRQVADNQERRDGLGGLDVAAADLQRHDRNFAVANDAR